MQRLFNGMSGVETIRGKTRMALNLIPGAAVEYELISPNFLNSRCLKIAGTANRATPPYSVERSAIWSSISEKFKTP